MISEPKAEEKETRRAEVAAAEEFLQRQGLAFEETRGERQTKRKERAERRAKATSKSRRA